MPSLSFIATANAVWQCGATPVFADIDPTTCNLDPAGGRARDHPAHQGGDAGPPGRPARRHGRASHELADRHGLTIVEDAACAIGAEHRGRPIGSPRQPHLLLAAPAQGHHLRRGRHDRRPRPGRRRAPATAAPARDGQVGPRPPRRRDGGRRALPRARLERPDDRPAGRRRAGAARGARRRSSPSAAGSPSATTSCWRPMPRWRLPCEPELRPPHLAVLRGPGAARTRRSLPPS